MTARREGKKEIKRKGITTIKSTPPANVPWGLDGGDEELGAVRVGAGVGHGEEAHALVLEGEVLVRDCGVCG